MIDETRQLRCYLGLGRIFLALAPLLMTTLLATDEFAPEGAAIPLLIAGPVNVVRVEFVVRSMLTGQREVSTRYLKIGAAIVIAATALLFGIRALAA